MCWKVSPHAYNPCSFKLVILVSRSLPYQGAVSIVDHYFHFVFPFIRWWTSIRLITNHYQAFPSAVELNVLDFQCDAVTFSRLEPEGKLVMGYRRAPASLTSQVFLRIWLLHSSV